MWAWPARWQRPGSTGMTSGFEEFIATTIPGAVKRLRPGVAPTWNFPRQGA